jgi:hypothetical protein
MDIDTLPFCCGVAVLGELPDEFWDYTENMSLREKIAELNSELNRNGSKELRPVLATLNTEQKDIWGTALNRCGFRQIKSFRNPNSGNTIFMYYRPEVGSKKAKKRKS